MVLTNENTIRSQIVTRRITNVNNKDNSQLTFDEVPSYL